MPVLQCVVGLVLVALGITLLARRQRLVARHELPRGRSVIGTEGWAVLGITLALAGLVQVVLAFV